MESQLLCTFATEYSLEETLKKIQDSYEIVFDKIFILQNKEQPNEFFCTYNVNSNHIPEEIPQKTISIHRKKQTNTLYTINALNEIIKLQNNGLLDHDFEVAWHPFENTLLVTNDEGVNIIPTKLFDIVEV